MPQQCVVCAPAAARLGGSDQACCRAGPSSGFSSGGGRNEKSPSDNFCCGALSVCDACILWRMCVFVCMLCLFVGFSFLGQL